MNAFPLLVNGREPREQFFAAAVNARTFGAIGDGVKDDGAALQDAFDFAAARGVPVFIGSYRFFSGRELTLGTSLYGNGGKIETSRNICLQITADNVKIKGVELVVRDHSATDPNNAPFAVYGISCAGFVLKDSVTRGGRIYVATGDALAAKAGMVLEGNKFYMDFSAYDSVLHENDAVTVGGVSDVLITGNQLNLVAVHRGIKVKGTEVGYFPTTGDSRRVVITHNPIVAVASAAHKQLIDLFAGSRSVIVADNPIEATGFQSIVENKTVRGAAGVTTTALVSKNVINTDTQTPFVFEGSYGNDNVLYNVGRCVVKIDGNIVVSSGALASALQTIKYYNVASFSDNDVIFTGGAGNVLAFGQCEQLKTDRNKLTKCQLGYSDFTGSQEGDTFSGVFRSIQSHHNEVNDFDVGFYEGGIGLRGITSPAGLFSLTHNTVRQTTASASPAGAVSARSCTFKTLDISRNASAMQSAAENRAFLVTLTGTVNEDVNSWNLFQYVGAWTPNGGVAIAAGATVYTDIAVPGVDFGTHQVISVTHSQLAVGVIIFAIVGGVDLVRVQIYNPTGGGIAVGAGTLRVTAKFTSSLF